ncbi:MAG TPA: HD domain-containing phosphohydrolase [Alphaproteobacteria bacterium]|nr:HD domain-containing phosphohydrolase [Alphaproteobacteria bacterium]
MTSTFVLPPPVRERPKAAIAMAFVLCPLLLLMSCYGFWQWFTLPPEARDLGRWEIFYLISLVVIPLALFVFMSVVAAQRLEHAQLSSSYQARIDQLQKRLNHQEDLLHLVTDYHPSALTIFDQDGRYWFVNRRAARDLGLEVKDVIGKVPVKLIGHDRARRLEARLAEVRMSGRPIEAMDRVIDKHQQVHFVQMRYETIEPFGELRGGVVMREEDLTNLIVERERRETMLQQVIQTLVAVVDRRDPYASGHSVRVGQLARAIAEEMVLDEKQIDAAGIAGSLMNFGKVLVPREILTKTTPLTPDELQRVRDSILTSADILSIIDFTAPVVSTLRQVLERYDGTGVPNGLKGDAIFMAARIVAVANAYVALVSPRAHRPSLGLKPAVDTMMQDADKIYDRRVVTALANYIENSPVKLDWLTAVKSA